MADTKRRKSTGSGSPSDGEPEYLVVGSLRRPHGVRGEIVMEILTDFPERLTPGTAVFLGAAHVPATIENSRHHHEGMVIKFRGVDTPEAAGLYRNQAVYVTAADRPPLPPGQYYEHQLLGFEVVDDRTQEVLGTLSEILHTGANDIYVVGLPGGRELLLPVIESVVLRIDTSARTIHVHLLPGLMENNE